jgi:hypothetical protein
VIFQSTKNKTNFFVPNFDKNLGFYTFPYQDHGEEVEEKIRR